MKKNKYPNHIEINHLIGIGALDLYCPNLKGCWDHEGWVRLHSVTNKHQRTSIQCLNILRHKGFKFDVQTADGNLFKNGNIDEFKVKIEYNVHPGLTPPDNGIVAWRPCNQYRTYINSALLTEGAIRDWNIVPKPWSTRDEINSLFNIKTNVKPFVPYNKALAEGFVTVGVIGKGPLTQEELYKAGLEPDNGPFYANDKYKREIKPGVFVDVYDVIDCFEVTSGALQHAVKKLLAAGKRGHKDYEQDLIDILSSVERALFQHQEKNK